MKPTHLIPLSAYVDEVSGLYYETDEERFLSFYMAINKYSSLLKETLHLGMFVPGVDGKPLEPFVSGKPKQKVPLIKTKNLKL